MSTRKYTSLTKNERRNIRIYNKHHTIKDTTNHYKISRDTLQKINYNFYKKYFSKIKLILTLSIVIISIVVLVQNVRQSNNIPIEYFRIIILVLLVLILCRLLIPLTSPVLKASDKTDFTLNIFSEFLPLLLSSIIIYFIWEPLLKTKFFPTRYYFNALEYTSLLESKPIPIENFRIYIDNSKKPVNVNFSADGSYYFELKDERHHLLGFCHLKSKVDSTLYEIDNDSLVQFIARKKNNNRNWSIEKLYLDNSKYAYHRIIAFESKKPEVFFISDTTSASNAQKNLFLIVCPEIEKVSKDKLSNGISDKDQLTGNIADAFSTFPNSFRVDSLSQLTINNFEGKYNIKFPVIYLGNKLEISEKYLKANLKALAQMTRSTLVIKPFVYNDQNNNYIRIFIEQNNKELLQVNYKDDTLLGVGNVIELSNASVWPKAINCFFNSYDYLSRNQYEKAEYYIKYLLNFFIENSNETSVIHLIPNNYFYALILETEKELAHKFKFTKKDRINKLDNYFFIAESLYARKIYCKDGKCDEDSIANFSSDKFIKKLLSYADSSVENKNVLLYCLVTLSKSKPEFKNFRDQIIKKDAEWRDSVIPGNILYNAKIRDEFLDYYQKGETNKATNTLVTYWNLISTITEFSFDALLFEESVYFIDILPNNSQEKKNLKNILYSIYKKKKNDVISLLGQTISDSISMSLKGE